MGEKTINKFNSKERHREVSLDTIDERIAAISIRGGGIEEG
jgi:hypothetical protein